MTSAGTGERYVQAKSRLRSLVGGSIGNLVEWYDWYVYSAFALYFSKSFFPQGDRTAQLLNTAAVFAIGFLMRPIGGWWLGKYADVRGRKAALTLSVLLMCTGSLLIAVVPPFAVIGVWAPVVLVVARLLQGLSVGGEYGTSATYMSEMATAKHRGFTASFQYVTLIMGQLLALGVLLVLQATMSDTDLNGWGWRIPFAVGAVLAVVALWLRRSIEETHSFEVLPASERRGIAGELFKHPRALLTVLGLTAGGSLGFYTFTTYMQKFLVNSAGWSKDDATSVSAVSLLLFMVLQPLFGALSDRFGRRPQLIVFAALGVLGTIPMLTRLSAAADWMTGFWLIMAALVVMSCYTAISGLVKAELFPAHIRALGVGLPYGIAVSVFGGSAEYVALKFKDMGHENWFFVYVTVMFGVALVAAWALPETRDETMIEDD
ncbi:MFS transporter [Polymorphobacter arshaanensis]|uniref:Alpha-ketoglutarate permease n=1 Tax=Glacieibacterium arshaanense TaxID=2511025 RepID=A0A4Y9ELU4_9SPHN|nr:MFS transporter [Polymorphobacter arshaanensis]